MHITVLSLQFFWNLTVCWFLSSGTILRTLHQTQWQEIPTDIWWWTLPASSRVPRTTGEREGATGRVCLPPDIWEVSSQVRMDSKKPGSTLGSRESSPCMTVQNIYMFGEWIKELRKRQIWNTFPESAEGVFVSLWLLLSFVRKCGRHSIVGSTMIWSDM